MPNENIILTHGKDFLLAKFGLRIRTERINHQAWRPKLYSRFYVVYIWSSYTNRKKLIIKHVEWKYNTHEGLLSEPVPAGKLSLHVRTERINISSVPNENILTVGGLIYDWKELIIDLKHAKLSDELGVSITVTKNGCSKHERAHNLKADYSWYSALNLSVKKWASAVPASVGRWAENCESQYSTENQELSSDSQQENNQRT